MTCESPIGSEKLWPLADGSSVGAGIGVSVAVALGVEVSVVVGVTDGVGVGMGVEVAVSTSGPGGRANANPGMKLRPTKARIIANPVRPQPQPAAAVVGYFAIPQ